MSKAFIRLRAKHDILFPKLRELVKIWDDVEKYAFTGHKASDMENEHVHIVVQFTKEFKALSKTLNARIAKDFPEVAKGNPGRAIESWDGSHRIFSYLYHEIHDHQSEVETMKRAREVALEHSLHLTEYYGFEFSEDTLDRFVLEGRKVKDEMDAKAKKAKDKRVPMEKVILSEVEKTGVLYSPSALLHRMVDGVTSREWSDPGYSLEKRFNEILLRQDGGKTYRDYVLARWQNRLKM